MSLTPLEGGARVYVGRTANDLYALEDPSPRSPWGRPVLIGGRGLLDPMTNPICTPWKTPPFDPLGTPHLDRGEVFFGSRDHMIYGG